MIGEFLRSKCRFDDFKHSLKVGRRFLTYDDIHNKLFYNFKDTQLYSKLQKQMKQVFNRKIQFTIATFPKTMYTKTKKICTFDPTEHSSEI